MNKNEIIESVLLQIRKHGIAHEIVSALTEKSAEGNLQETNVPPPVALKAKFRSFELYYDDETKEPVGVIYGNMVILKQTSKEKMAWGEAEAYCRSVVINGMTASLCPVMPEWKDDVVGNTQDLAAALEAIGAENLDTPTWCEAYQMPESLFADLYAWYLCLGSQLSNGCKCDYKFYVRPVLLL